MDIEQSILITLRDLSRRLLPRPLAACVSGLPPDDDDDDDDDLIVILPEDWDAFDPDDAAE